MASAARLYRHSGQSCQLRAAICCRRVCTRAHGSRCAARAAAASDASTLPSVTTASPPKTPSTLPEMAASPPKTPSTLPEMAASPPETVASSSATHTADVRLQLGLLLGSGVLLQMGIGMIVPCLPAYAQSLGLAESSVGILVAVPSFARALLNLPAGRLADLVGRKKPMIFGSVLDGCGTIATAAAGGLPSMTACRLVMGSGSSIAGNALEAYTQDVVNAFPRHKGRIMGARQAAATVAWVAGPILGGCLAEAGGVGLPFVLVGGAILATVPALQLLLPETRPRAAGALVLSAATLRPLVADAARGFGRLGRDRNQRALLLAQCGLFTGWSASLALVPLYAAATFGATPRELGTLYALMAVLGVVGGPAGGWMADAVGRKPALLVGSTICAAAFGALPFLQTQPAALGAMAAVGFGESFLMSAAAALANDVTPAELRGSQSALLNQVGDLTFVAMPVALTVVATHASYTAAFVCTASMIGAANAGFALLARPPPLPGGAASGGGGRGAD